MDGLHVPAAAPWKQHFAGEEFWLEPLTLEDWATVEKRLVQRRPDPIELAKASLDGLDLATKRELLESALRRAMEHDRATVEELKQFIETPEGMALVLWLAIRRRHPRITEQRAYELLMRLGDEQLSRLEANVQGASGGEGLAKN